MSTQKGNVKKSRPPKYRNRSAFKNVYHDTSIQTQRIISTEVDGVCARCKDIIDWRIRYKKYKPLSQPKTCVSCKQKTVKKAYYVYCVSCSESSQKCAKCGDKKEVVIKPSPSTAKQASEQREVQFELELLPERKRRALLRYKEYGSQSPDKDSSKTEDADCSNSDKDVDDEDVVEDENLDDDGDNFQKQFDKSGCIHQNIDILSSGAEAVDRIAMKKTLTDSIETTDLCGDGSADSIETTDLCGDGSADSIETTDLCGDGSADSIETTDLCGDGSADSIETTDLCGDGSDLNKKNLTENITCNDELLQANTSLPKSHEFVDKTNIENVSSTISGLQLAE